MLQNEYLRAESKILNSKIEGRILFTNDERLSLVGAALAMGRKLMQEVVGIVKPETILAWQRRLEREKWDYSARKKRGPGERQRPPPVMASRRLCKAAARSRPFGGPFLRPKFRRRNRLEQSAGSRQSKSVSVAES